MKKTSSFKLVSASPLCDKSFALAIRIINLYKHLKNERNEYVLCKQILRAGTSIGANIREAQRAESPSDFIHKLSIAQKELSETQYWLELLLQTDYLTNPEFQSLAADTSEVSKMLSSAILTKKKKLGKY